MPITGSSATEQGEKPNFLVIITDDQTHTAIQALHDTQVLTPNIDRLVETGISFTHSFSMGAWHGAVCVASRAMLMTGRYLWDCGGGHCGNYPLWRETFGRAGYNTFAAGKWHNGKESLEKSFHHRGKAVCQGMFRSFDPYREENAAKGFVKDPYDRPRPGNHWSPSDTTLRGHWRQVNGNIVHSSELWADAAIDFLTEQKDNDQPFFMYVAFHVPHDPRQSPEEYLEEYPVKEIKLPPNYLPVHPFDPMGNYRTLRDERLAPFPRSVHDVQVHLREYYAIISHADHHIGRILDALKQSGNSENTYIVFTSDHGLAVGSHGLMGKQNQYDHSVRMPLIIAGPGIPSGETRDAMVYMQSLFATTCELAGIRVPGTVQFGSLLPLIRDPGKQNHECIYGAYTSHQRMVRTSRYKLIRYPHADRIQLFDLEFDPQETKDISKDPAYDDVIEELNEQMKEKMDQYHDPLDPEFPEQMILPF